MVTATTFEQMATGENCPTCDGDVLLSVMDGWDAGVVCDCAALGVLV